MHEKPSPEARRRALEKYLGGADEAVVVPLEASALRDATGKWSPERASKALSDHESLFLRLGARVTFQSQQQAQLIAAGMKVIAANLVVVARVPVDARSSYTLPRVHEAIACCHQAAGNAHELRHERDGAIEQWQLAVQWFSRAGAHDRAKAVERKIEALGERLDGDVDASFTRIVAELEHCSGDPIETTKRLIELGDLRLQQGDAHGSVQAFRAAEQTLEAHRPTRMDAATMARSLLDAVRPLADGSLANDSMAHFRDVVAAMQVRGLYKEVYDGLFRALGPFDPAQARVYLEKKESIDSAREHREFCEAARSEGERYRQNMLKRNR